MHNWFITTQGRQLEYYKGLQIHAVEGLHEQMLAMFQKYVPAGQQVLDVGAGEGAFSLRLYDHGYQVVGLDANNTPQYQWKAQGVPFVQCDINSSLKICLNQTFDVVCCMEVIEHIENPWQLIRDIKAVLRPGGIAIVSTPNVNSFYSRIRYMQMGTPVLFGEEGVSMGHINPITTFEMIHIAKSVGFAIQEIAPGGYLPILDFSSFSPNTWLRNAARLIAYIASRCVKNGHVKNGYITMFVLQNPC